MTVAPQDHLAQEADQEAGDPRVPKVKERILEHFRQHPEDVFYERQLAVFFEGDYFHWLTSRALRELEDQGKLASDFMRLSDNVAEGAEEVTLRFYRMPRLRSWRRKAQEKVKVVREFAAIGKPMGKHAETQFDAGFAGIGFKREAMNVREWGGRVWTKSGHNLDRVYSRDGVAYGAEIKNTLRYIDAGEFYRKLAMCEELALHPLFIVRMMPGDYIFKVFERGGFVIVFKYQMYPYGHEALAERVRLKLGFPTGTEIAARTLKRFEQGHLRMLVDGGRKQGPV